MGGIVAIVSAIAGAASAAKSLFTKPPKAPTLPAQSSRAAPGPDQGRASVIDSFRKRKGGAAFLNRVAQGPGGRGGGTINTTVSGGQSTTTGVKQVTGN